MINSVLVNNITNITELKKNPVVVANTDITCVLSNGKPCFYTVSNEKMENLSEFLGISDENEMLVFKTIMNEMTGYDRDYLRENCEIGKVAFARIVISLAVNFAGMGSVEEVIKSLEV